MKFSISESKAFSHIVVEMNPGEGLLYEPGSMVYHTSSIKVKAKKSGGGIMSSLAKSVVAGENYFIGEAFNEGSSVGTIALSPKTLGEIKRLSVGEKQWMLSDGSFLTSTSEVSVKVSKQKGIKNALFSGTGGMYILSTQGTGDIYINGFGELIEIELNDEELVVDTNHVSAWTTGLEYKIVTSGGIVNSWKSGEGLVTNFKGTGTIIIQTANIENFANQLIPFLPTPSSV